MQSTIDLKDESLDSNPLVKLADDFKELIDICDYPEQTDAVELKQLSWEK